MIILFGTRRRKMKIQGLGMIRGKAARSRRPTAFLPIILAIMTVYFVAGVSENRCFAQTAETGTPKAGMTVSGVVTMLQAGVSEDIILSQLHKSKQTFTLTAADTEKLKGAGASDKLLTAMSDTSAQKKSHGFFKQLGDSIKQLQEQSNAGSQQQGGGSPGNVVDRMGLRDILPQYDSYKPVSEQYPHIAVTVLKTPPSWSDVSVGQYCFTLSVVVWSNEKTSKTVGPFDWCSPRDLEVETGPMASMQKPKYLSDETTGIARTNGPVPPRTLFPEDPATKRKWANANSERSLPVSFDLSFTSRIGLMFYNLREEMGWDAGQQDPRIWLVSIQE
jgi:hypothetical protein